jgi:hypothetical protein
LKAEEVYGLAQSVASGVQSVQIALLPVNFAITETLPITYDEVIFVDNSGANFSQWQYTFPTDLAEGFYELYLRGIDVNNRLGRDEGVWRGLIDMVSPTITVTAQHTMSGGLPVTNYSFTFSDFLLDETSYDQPCALGDLVTQAYDDVRLPHNGVPYEVSGACQVAGHEFTREFTVCDGVGHCTTVAPFVPTEVCGITDNQAYSFGDLTIFVEPGGLGDIDCLQVTQVAQDHPAATVGIQTGNYWHITALNSSSSPASNYTTTLTLTLPFIPDADDKLCRYTGSNDVWDCAANSFDAGNQTITRNDVTQFSSWAVGVGVGPTAVSLQSVAAEMPAQRWVWLVMLLLGLATAVGGIVSVRTLRVFYLSNLRKPGCQNR